MLLSFRFKHISVLSFLQRAFYFCHMLFDRLSYFFSISKNSLGSLNICKEISAVLSVRPCSPFGVPLVQMILLLFPKSIPFSHDKAQSAAPSRNESGRAILYQGAYFHSIIGFLPPYYFLLLLAAYSIS